MAGCIFGLKTPFPNDVSKQVVDFIYKYATENKDPSVNIEFEAKFGKIIDLGTVQRLDLPILTETGTILPND